jgi:hypothetical protein
MMRVNCKGFVCEACNETFDASHPKQRFCSKACSNKTVKRRVKKVSYCAVADCNNAVEYHLNKFCRCCITKGAHWARNSNVGKLLENQTIEEASHRRAGGANAYDNIRAHARKLMKDEIDKGCGCFNCGWNQHVQVCHIKAINLFSKDALVSEVNNPTNLVLLCPNCHWLFDNSKLKLVGATGFEPVTVLDGIDRL